IPEGKHYGFITASDQRDYFFHETDMNSGTDWEQVKVGMKVVFEVKKQAYEGHNGAASHVCLQELDDSQPLEVVSEDKFTYY
ncbi:MAG: cold shock domain-containing protein, partial [Deltaproteobacteria bacterium]|nr:cold shock domain-containing protein [Deltaproteobacteria bacterium]